ncbi:uncharacterized protein L969DRAFT_95753 [Mixia osmundae IAM 14324]|uniref:Uncharacterized protein n=1 Tax=Mixia osmundae (strain CBS 9802 / IAM 14324 / JCM 22182 / KY 12970) TaxID=764103 RepID=G7DSP1_MIXOS|nr:uncharacterized protein L969DRAFT_95753 [Mixia osmundae IAM 14324]KEI37902.1 hypothetical protein L969DRAFT_95753 [Mixia osmundae IAM 14324]GAA93601.1 hypothetical protein E5Q_00245 [Mixia osmundae IAM 14324]
MATISSTPVVIDAKGHLLGRLASIVAKQALSGQKIVVVRAEEINVSGSFFRLKLRYAEFMHKRHLVNPKKSGPFHHRSPASILKRTIRGMLPHKSARGVAAMSRIKAFEGVPPPYDKQKRVVVPNALRVLRLKPGRKFCTIKVRKQQHALCQSAEPVIILQRLSHEYGWGYKDVVDRLEEKRKVKNQAYYERKIQLTKARTAARKAVASKDTAGAEKLAAYGFA